jgi:hypothetical protein
MVQGARAAPASEWGFYCAMAGEPDTKARGQDLDELVFECLERLDDRGLPAIEALLAAHPEAADSLRRRVGLLAAAGLLPEGREDGVPERLGRFRVGERVRSGPRAVLFRAQDLAAGGEVELLVLRPGQLDRPGERERFVTQARRAARVAAPGLLAVRTVGEEAGVPFVATEPRPGLSLAEVLRALGGRSPERLRGADLGELLQAVAPEPRPDSALPPLFAGSYFDTARRIVQRVAAALAVAHEHGLGHDALDAAAIDVTAGGRVVVSGCGLPALQSGSGDGFPPDGRADVYALGAILHQLLSLRPPAGRGAPPPLPRSIRGQLPVDLEAVRRRALDPDPERRHTGVAELARDLERVGAGEPLGLPAAGPVARGRAYLGRHPGRAAAALALIAATWLAPTALAFAALHQGRAARAELRTLALESEARQHRAAQLGTELAAREQVRRASDLAALRHAEGDPAQARVLLEGALERAAGPDRSTQLFALAELALERGEDATGCEWLRQAVAADDAEPTAPRRAALRLWRAAGAAAAGLPPYGRPEPQRAEELRTGAEDFLLVALEAGRLQPHDLAAAAYGALRDRPRLAAVLAGQPTGAR